MQSQPIDVPLDDLVDLRPEVDPDSELLANVARGVHDAPDPAQPEAVARTTAAAFNVFIDTPLAPTVLRSAQLRVPEVDLDDLVEDLATTAAALRARRAA